MTWGKVERRAPAGSQGLLLGGLELGGDGPISFLHHLQFSGEGNVDMPGALSKV